MSTVREVNSQEFTYHQIDGMITRSNRNKGVFQTRRFDTGEWVKTVSPQIVQKMMTGRGRLDSKETANTLFDQFQANITKV